MLMDVLLVTVSSAKSPGFWTKDTLFRSPVVGRLLRALKAIPVARRQDHGGM
jgi:1-acyl-sn-glycerol-3-phosphate acyltransferase